MFDGIIKFKYCLFPGMSLHDAVNKISRSLDLVREINDEICNESRSAHYGGFFDRQVEITCPLFEKDAKELVEILNSGKNNYSFLFLDFNKKIYTYLYCFSNKKSSKIWL